MGNRTKTPKAGGFFSPFRGTSMNIVVGCRDEEREEFHRRTSRRGIDFCFDGSFLNLSVRYQRLLHGSGLESCPSPLLRDCITHKVGDRRENVLLLPSLDEEFESEGVVFYVHRVDVELRRVTAKPSETNSNQRLVFSTDTELENLKQLIDQYNS